MLTHPYRQDPKRPTKRDLKLADQSLRRLECSNCDLSHDAKGWPSPRCPFRFTPETNVCGNGAVSYPRVFNSAFCVDRDEKWSILKRTTSTLLFI